MPEPVRLAIFPVAGLGTRFLPATKAIPKEMLPILDRPLIQYAVDEARAAGIESFIFITAQGKTAIEDHFDASLSLEAALASKNKHAELKMLQSLKLDPGQAVFVRQQEAKGLGHAVWCARHFVGNRPFALILPDDFILGQQPCLRQMMPYYEKWGGNIVAAMDVSPEHVSRYGILDISKDDGTCITVRGVVEKPTIAQAPSQTAIVGRYILQPEIFPILEKQSLGVGNEIQLTDAFVPLLESQPFHALRFSGQRFDCGTKEGWLEANIAMACTCPDLFPHLLQAVDRHITQKRR